MKKIGLLCLALVLALGTLGVAFAYWNETLTIEAPINTGELDMQVCEGWLHGSFIDPPLGFYPGSDDAGSWWNYKDIKYYGLFQWPVRGDYDVGECTITYVNPRTYTVTLSDVYPGYMAKVWWAMHNTGTIPVKIKSVTIPAESIVDNDGLMPYVRSAGRVKIQKGQWGWWRRYDKHWFNCDSSYSNPGLLAAMPGALEDKMGGYVLQPGWRILIGCVDEEDEEFDEEEQGNSLLFVIDEGAPDSIEGATLSFDLEMTWTQFND